MQNIPELRQFVQPGSAEKAAQTRAAAVVPLRPSGAILFRVQPHGAQLQDHKWLSVFSQALLAEKAKALPQTPGNLCLFEDGLDGTGLRVLANAGMERCGGICAVFAGTDQAGYRYAMGSQTVDLRAKAKALHQALGGKGGGQPTLIQGAVTASRQEILAYFR